MSNTFVEVHSLTKKKEELALLPRAHKIKQVPLSILPTQTMHY